MISWDYTENMMNYHWKIDTQLIFIFLCCIACTSFMLNIGLLVWRLTRSVVKRFKHARHHTALCSDSTLITCLEEHLVSRSISFSSWLPFKCQSVIRVWGCVFTGSHITERRLDISVFAERTEES